MIRPAVPDRAGPRAVAFGLALAAGSMGSPSIAGCGGELPPKRQFAQTDGQTGGQTTTPAGDSTPGPTATPPVARTPGLPSSCDDLVASEHPTDRSLVVALCPSHLPSLDAAGLRTLLLAVATRAEAQALAPHLTRAPDLQGLARLIAGDGGPDTPEADPPDPRRTQVTPITDRVLAHARTARTTVLRDRDHTARVHARAFLFRLYSEALQQLGHGDPGPLPPGARLLVAEAVHHGRLLCTQYWQRRVAGMARTFAATEVQLYRFALSLDLTPHHGDPARLAHERDGLSRYLGRDDVEQRIHAALGDGHATRLPLANELDRLLDLGFVDRAFERGLYLGATPGGHGIGPIADLLDRRLRAKGLEHHRPRLAQAVASFRARTPPPPESGPQSLDHRVDVRWALTEEVADRLSSALQNLDGHRGFARRVALGRLLVELRTRPDVVRMLAERVDPGTDPDRDAVLAALLDADHGDGTIRIPLLARLVPAGDRAVRLAAAAPHPGD